MSGCSSAALFALTTALLSSCAASGSVSKKIQAYVGDTVVLPCSITARNDIPTLEWSRKGHRSEIAFLYRDGCETFEMKSPVFQFRTNLFMSQLKNGNMSLRISELRLSDQGEYQCKIMEPGTSPKVIETVKLLVGAASEPRLSVVSGEGDTMVLQCQSNCWFPVPNITFLDDQGNDITAHKPMRDQDSQRCFHVKRNVTLQADTKRVTCRVHQPQINQARDAEINIPGRCTRSSSENWILFVVAVIVCVISCVATFMLHKKCSSCACMKTKKLSDRGTTSLNAQVCNKGNEPDNTEDVTAERLRKLESDLREKEKIIQQLTEQLDRRSTSLSGSSSADISDPTNPPNSSPNNSLPKSRSVSQNRDSVSPVKGHHGNGSRSSLLDNNDALSSSDSSASSSGEQNRIHLRKPESHVRRNSSSIARSFTMSKGSTEDSKPLMETRPENEEI